MLARKYNPNTKYKPAPIACAATSAANPIKTVRQLPQIFAAITHKDIIIAATILKLDGETSNTPVAAQPQLMIRRIENRASDCCCVT